MSDPRRAAEAATGALERARADFLRDASELHGRALLAARERASVALAALWNRFPEERPPSQRVM